MIKRFPATVPSTGGAIGPNKCALPCLFTGARILTANGIVRVENLCPKDRILTRHSGFQQVEYVLVQKTRIPETAVVIRKGFYKDVCAERDLLLSSHQRILSSESVRNQSAIPCQALIYAKDVSIAAPARASSNLAIQSVTLFFQHSELIMADGIWVECCAAIGALAVKAVGGLRPEAVQIERSNSREVLVT